jgi:hypothetical protein
MSEYADYQTQRDREYTEAWKKLTPAQRKRLAKAGIQGPDTPVYHTSKRDDEGIVERAQDASRADDPVDATPGNVEQPNEATLAALRRVLGELMAHDNIRLTLDCFSLVTGVGYQGESMVTIAGRHGITRAAVSKRCVEVGDALSLPPSRAMRQLTARQAYERRARRNHSRSAG